MRPGVVNVSLQRFDPRERRLCVVGAENELAAAADDFKLIRTRRAAAHLLDVVERHAALRQLRVLLLIVQQPLRPRVRDESQAACHHNNT